MNTFLGMPEADRRDAFVVAADQVGLPPSAVEKDFWVCWTLRTLFEEPTVGRYLAFRGGTSLSKVWGFIQRFSEDIDLVVAPGALGIDPAQLPSVEASKNQNMLRSERLVEACEYWASQTVMPALSRAVGGQSDTSGCKLALDAQNPACLLLTYPPLLPRLDYTGNVVRIELCAKADPDPTEPATIKPYVLEQLAGLDPRPETRVTTVSARRTFWEKACLLHAYCHSRGVEHPRRHLSRHAYDLWKLDQAGIAETCITDPDLLRSVVGNQMTSFRVNGLDYADIKPGSLRLVPDERRLMGLASDYAALRDAMIFGTSPEFSELIEGLEHLESRINQRA